MPPLPSVPGVLSAQTIFSVGTDSNVRCKWFFSYTGGPPSATDLNTMAATAFGAAGGSITQDLCSAYSCTGVELIDLSSATGAAGIATGLHGGLSGPANLSAAACVICNAAIARRYRGGKPRTYWPLGIQTNLASPQTWTSTILGFFQTHLNAWRNEFLSLSAGATSISAHVNVSYYQGFTVLPPDPVTGRVKTIPKLRTTPHVDTITSISINPRVGTQRRRISA